MPRRTGSPFAPPTSPRSPAHWYNLGATYYRLGHPGRAEAAWLRARRLDPREPSVRRALHAHAAAGRRVGALDLVAPGDARRSCCCRARSAGSSAGSAGSSGRAIRERWLVLLVFAGTAVLGGLALRAWYRRPLAIVLDDATLRLSPHGRAPALAPVEGGSAVRLVRTARGLGARPGRRAAAKGGCRTRRSPPIGG